MMNNHRLIFNWTSPTRRRFPLRYVKYRNWYSEIRECEQKTGVSAPLQTFVLGVIMPESTRLCCVVDLRRQLYVLERLAQDTSAD